MDYTYGVAAQPAQMQPNLIIHYSSIHPGVALVSRIVAIGRKDVYYTGQTIQFIVNPGFHQIVLKIGKINYNRTVTVPADGTPVEIFAAYNGRGQISINVPFVEYPRYPVSAKIQQYVMSHSGIVDTRAMVDRRGPQYAVPTSAGYTNSYTTSADYANQSFDYNVVDSQKNIPERYFSPIPIIAFLFAFTGVGSIIGMILGIISAKQNVKVKGLGIAAIPIGAVGTIIALIILSFKYSYI